MNIKNASFKNVNLLMLVLLLLSVAAIFIIAVLDFPVLSFVGIVAFIVFSCAYSVIISYGNIVYVVLVPAITLAALAAKSLTDANISLFSGLMNTAFSLAAALCLAYCEKARASKTVTYVAVSSVTAADALSNAVLIIFSEYGSASANTVKKAVSDIATAFGNIYRNVADAFSAGTAQDASITEYINTLADVVEYSVRANVVCAMVVYGMVIAAVVIALYGTFVKLAGVTEKCFDGRLWFFKMSKTSAYFFYLVYAAYFITDVFVGNSVLAAAFMNVSTVLTVPFAYTGLRFLCVLIQAKTKSRATAVLILAAVSVGLGIIVGLNTVIILVSFVGASVEIRSSYILKG